MTHPTPGAPPGAPPRAEPAAPSIWGRINDDLHKRPRRYINGVAMIAVPVLIIVLGVQFWRSHRSEETGKVAIDWADTDSADTTPKARAAALEELGARLTTEPHQAFRLYELAATYKDLAEQAATHDEKVAYYEKMLASATELKSKYANSLWAKMPTRPPTSVSAPTLPAIEQLRDMAQRQLDWLKAHPYTGAVEADPNLKVTVELEDGRKFVIGKFFSRAAPLHVQNFVELARKGYFEGTAMSKIGQGYKKGTQPKQGDRPPTISIEGGHPMTKVTPENREDDDDPSDIGYSVREEPNPLPVVRGSISAVGDPQTGGDSPSKFKVFGDEPNYSAGETVFAEVTEGLDVVDSLLNAPTAENRPSRPRDLARIKKMTVEGSVFAPPERAFPPELRMPEGPESKPADSRPETQPATRESRPTDPPK